MAEKPLRLIPGAKVLRLSGSSGTYHHPPVTLLDFVSRPAEPVGETWTTASGEIVHILPGSLVMLPQRRFWYVWYLKHNTSSFNPPFGKRAE